MQEKSATASTCQGRFNIKMIRATVVSFTENGLSCRYFLAKMCIGLSDLPELADGSVCIDRIGFLVCLWAITYHKIQSSTIEIPVNVIILHYYGIYGCKQLRAVVNSLLTCIPLFNKPFLQFDETARFINGDINFIL